jgi:hypothetical protein
MRALAAAIALMVQTEVTAQLAQPVTKQLGPSTCPACRVHLARMPTRIQPVSDIGFSTDTKVARVAGGRYAVAPTTNVGEVSVFDSTGKLVQRVGRRGRGPGEMDLVLWVKTGHGDTLFVADDLNRITVFDPDFKYARAFDTPGPIGDIAFFPAARSFLLHFVPSRILGVSNLQWYRGSERIELPLSRDAALDFPRFIKVAIASNGSFAVAKFDQWQIDVFGNDGVHRRRLQRPWPTQLKRGQGFITAMTFSDNLLWVRYQVRNDQKLPEPRKINNEAVPMVPTVEELGKYWEHYLDVVDVSRGELIVTTRLGSPLLGGFAGGNIAWGFVHRAADLETEIDLWRFQLRRPT